MPKTVFVTVGTRPEAIKMAPLYLRMQRTDGLRPVLVSTGQHREMLDQVFDWFGIAPDEDLAVMTPNQTVSQVMVKSLSGLDALIAKHEPDAVLAQGDTTTVLAAALAAFNTQTPFGHVEAGLRTYDLERPFPEEGYRQMASRVARWHFAPTPRAAETLAGEKLQGDVHMVGNTVIDALLDTAKRADALPVEIADDKRMVLITGHRRENHAAFRKVFAAFRTLADRYADIVFVYPVHLNPNVQTVARDVLSGTSNFHLIEPVDYPGIVSLMKRATLIVTDSGGIQEEAPSLKVPLLVMRETTERQESVEVGASRLIGTDPETLLREASRLLDSAEARREMVVETNPFGDGLSSQRICRILAEDLNA
ncbi:MAG: UDP-N-acetylglucosamine 2-epimerase (non-hydrolyzing) [Litorimonas sp.]